MAENIDAGTAAYVWINVLQAIYDGRYAPGQRLTEAALTKQFAVSRSSVREALSRLAAEGVLAIHRHKGAIVRPADKAEFLETLVVLRSLISLGVRLATENAGLPESQTALKEELKRLASQTDVPNGIEFAKAGNGFFRTLWRVAGNAELTRLMAHIHFHPILIHLCDESFHTIAIDHYISILSSIAQQDGERAVAIVEEHVDMTTKHVLRLSS
jgi:DNA-binding GntR family transcriptional regulator